MKRYESPVAEVTELNCEDILLLSAESNGLKDNKVGVWDLDVKMPGSGSNT